MLTLISSKLRYLLILFLIVLGVSFIFFDHGNLGNSGAANPRIAKLDGKTVSRSDFESAYLDSSIIYILQTGRRPMPQMEQLLRAQTWNRLLVLSAGKEVGLQPSPTDAINFVKTHPLFLDEKGVYSPTNFQNFSLNVLRPQGISDARFQEIIQEQLIFEQMLKSISSTVIVRPSEIQETYAALYGQVSLHYVTLDEAPLRNAIKPSVEELKAYYVTKQNQFMTPELRKVEYILFRLKPEQLKLPEDQKNTILRELTQQAYQFTEPFFGTSVDTKSLPDFRTAAAKAGLNVQISSPITAMEPLLPSEAESIDLTKVAFLLNPKSPVSDYKKTTNGYVVLHLLEVSPPAAIPFEAVQAQVEKMYLTEKTSELIEEKGKTLAKDLQSSIAAGKTWDEAVKALSLTSTSVPAFSPAKDTIKSQTAADAIRFWAQRLKPGAVSEFSRTTTGGMIFFLADRKVPTETNQEQVFQGIKEQLQQQRRNQILDDWISSRIHKSGNNIPSDLLRGDEAQSL